MLGLERDDLEKAAVLYENIRAHRRRKDKQLDKRLAEDFVKFLEDKMQKTIVNYYESKYSQAYQKCTYS